jgi:hypothetical protein
MTRNVVCRDSSNLPNSNCDQRLKPGENKGCKASTDCPIILPTSAPTAQVINRSPTKKRRINKTTPTDSTTTEGIPVDYQTPDIDNDIYVEGSVTRHSNKIMIFDLILFFCRRTATRTHIALDSALSSYG